MNIKQWDKTAHDVWEQTIEYNGSYTMIIDRKTGLIEIWFYQSDLLD